MRRGHCAACPDPAFRDGLCKWHWRRVQRQELTGVIESDEALDYAAPRTATCRWDGLPAVTPDRLCRAHCDAELAGAGPEIEGESRRERVRPGHCAQCGMAWDPLDELGRCTFCAREARRERVHSVGPDAPRRVVLIALE